MFQWLGRRDFGITALPPLSSKSYHLFQTDHWSWEHPQPCSHPGILGTGAERRDSPVLIAELHHAQGVMLFRKDSQELPLTASDTGFCPSFLPAPEWSPYRRPMFRLEMLRHCSILHLGAIGSSRFLQGDHIPKLKDLAPPCSHVNITSWNAKPISQFCIY